MKLNTKLNNFLLKYANNKSLYIIIIIGVAFMLLPTMNSKKAENQKSQAYDAYSDEAKLTEILEKVDGAGNISVMITYFGTSGLDIAFEEKKSDTTTESSAISDNGSPFIKGELYPKVKGVIVVSSGADNFSVKKALTDAVTAVLDVPSYRVCVLEGKERN